MHSCKNNLKHIVWVLRNFILPVTSTLAALINASLNAAYFLLPVFGISVRVLRHQQADAVDDIQYAVSSYAKNLNYNESYQS